MLSGVYYGARSNITGKEEWLVYAAFATRECLRQEENQYLANDLSKIAELPLHDQRSAFILRDACVCRPMMVFVIERVSGGW